MTAETLNKIFTKNYNKYKETALLHTNYIYDIDIVMSNIYLHLNKHLDELKTTKDVYAYVIQFSYGLKIWRQRRHRFITEKLVSDKQYEFDIIDGEKYDYLYNNITDITFDYENEIEYYLYNFIKEEKIEREDELLIRDIFDYNLKNYKDYMTFYNQRITYAYKIKNQADKIMNKFKEYLIKKNKENYV